MEQVTETVLPLFGVAGIMCHTTPHTLADDLASLWRQWLSGSLKERLPAFSRTVYCVFGCENGRPTRLLLGYLQTGEAALPPEASVWWLPPQHYRVFTLPDSLPDTAAACWHGFGTDTQASSYHFASYPQRGAAQIYLASGTAAVSMDDEPPE